MKLTPLILIATFGFLLVLGGLHVSARREAEEVKVVAFSSARARSGRTILVIVDSLRPQNLVEQEMPHLVALSRRKDARRFELRTCSANFSLQCLQTLLEGQESPFAADLKRFIGGSSAEGSLLSLAHDAKITSMMLSYRELVSLYKQFTTRWIDSEDWAMDHLERDLRSVDETLHVMETLDPQLVVLHIDGTDKAAHYKRPGTASYRQHFRAVDGRLAKLYKRLDFSRDVLLVTGDHGHSEQGHHTRRSVSIFVGTRFSQFLDLLELPQRSLQARDLLFFLAYPLGLTLPQRYEGAYFPPAAERTVPDEVRWFFDQQRLALSARGVKGETFAHQARAVQGMVATKHLESLYANLPLLSCYLGLLMWWFGWRDFRSRGYAAVVFGALAVALYLFKTGPGSVWLAAPILLVGTVPVLWRVSRRRVLFIVMIIFVSGTLSYVARDWALFFHIKDEFRLAWLLFYASLLVSGAIFAWVETVSLAQLPRGALTYALFCLPCGVYYYQIGQNMLQAYIWGATILGLIWLIARRERIRALLSHFNLTKAVGLGLVLLCTPLLMTQEAGAWQWHWLPAQRISALGPWLILLLYYPVGVLLVLRLRTTARRLVFAALWIGCHLYSVVLGQMPPGSFIAAFVPLVFFIGWDKLLWPGSGPAPDEVLERSGLVLFAALYTSEWFMFSGFKIAHADFAFTEAFLGGVKHQENIFMLTFAATTIKYGFPTIVTLAFVFFRRGARTWSSLLEYVFFFLHFKFALLGLQVFIGALGTAEKLYQLAMTEMVFVALLFLVVLSTYLAALTAVGARRLAGFGQPGTHP